jgi:hypothetical protein
VRNIGAGRKKKTCAVCGTDIAVGSPATTFTKRDQSGLKKIFKTIDTCHSNLAKCAERQAAILNINLQESFIN